MTILGCRHPNLLIYVRTIIINKKQKNNINQKDIGIIILLYVYTFTVITILYNTFVDMNLYMLLTI